MRKKVRFTGEGRSKDDSTGTAMKIAGVLTLLLAIGAGLYFFLGKSLVNQPETVVEAEPEVLPETI